MNYEYKIGYLDDFAHMAIWSTYAKDEIEAIQKFRKMKGNRIIVKLFREKRIGSDDDKEKVHKETKRKAE